MRVDRVALQVRHYDLCGGRGRLLKLNSQEEWEESHPPKKGRKTKAVADREPDLSGTGAVGTGSEGKE